MKYFMFLFFIINSVSAQTCDIENELKNVEALTLKGHFTDALTKVKQLYTCDALSDKEQIELSIWEYKLYRNTTEKKKAYKAMRKARKIFKDKNIVPSTDQEILIAESYATVRKDERYEKSISKIDFDQLDTLNKVRYFFSKFLITDKVGDTYTAIDYLQKGLAVVGNTSDHYKSAILMGLGNMHSILADYDKALSFYQRELDLLSSVYSPDHMNIAKSNYHIGNMYYGKLEYQKAVDHYVKAHKVWHKVYPPDFRYMRYLNEAMGDMYWELGDKKNALKYFNLATLNQKNTDKDISKSYINQADSLLNKGNYSEAMTYYNDAYEWRKNTFGKNHVVTGACQNFVARAIGSSGNIEAALDSYQIAIDILVKEMDSTSRYENPTLDMTFQSHHYLLESLIAKANLFRQLYDKNVDIKDLKAAFDTQTLVVDVLDEMKNKQSSDASKLFWTNHVSSVIEEGIATAIQLHKLTKDRTYLEKAFLFSEKNKALLLLSVIQEQDITSFSKVPKETIQEEKALKKDITQISGKIANEENRCAERRAKIIELWRTELDEKQNAYDILVNSIKTKYPEYYKLKYDVKISSLQEVQETLLDDKTALISYFTGTDNAYVFFVTNQDVSVREISGATKLTEEISSFFNLISSKKEFTEHPTKAFNSYCETSYSLYEKLLFPEISNTETIDNLIIIPDGLLAYIPFESLLTKSHTKTTRNYKTLPYLIKSFAISYSPSASIKLATNSTNSEQDYVGFAPDYSDQNYTASRQKLAKLAYNQEEVNYASKLLDGKQYSGNSATEDTMKSIVSTAGILHLAMHGDVEDTEPLLSKLYFNPSEKDDGLLHTYEIYNLTIPAQLVILSACNTATGKLQKGEGILSLERAFQYAGSKSLISTLWTVDDQASSKLTQLFLEQLKKGKTKDIALQQAKIEYLNSATPEVLPPYYWSSYKLTGSTEALSKSSNTIYYILGSFMIFLFVLVAIRKKKKRSAAA
ncbi:CHAT domain-containing protein [Kordia sp.]|uniref:CHAT domain-containing protein n=1 Tax=Kordia sp. TaxID=1965332 RepID=UPI003D6ADC59